MKRKPNANQSRVYARDVKIYRPNRRHELGIIQTWTVMFQNIRNSRELIWQLFKRDFFATYKKSFIGISWIFISPIAAIVSWVFLQKTGLLNPGELSIPYPAYVLIGSSMWGLFMGFFVSSSETLNAGKALILQVSYPHEALLFKQTAEHLSNFVITFAVNIAVLAAFNVFPAWQAVFFPVVACPLFFLGAGLGLVTSMFSIVAVDISKIMHMAMGLLMYVTPVIYSDRIDSSAITWIIKWNPLTYLVCSARDIVIFGKLYHPTGYFISTAMSFVVFMISWRLFFISEDKIVERMI